MKRTLAYLLVVALAILSMAADCGKKSEPLPEPKPLTLEEALAQCGPDCVAVIFQVDVYDEDRIHVPLQDGIEAELILDALASTPDSPTPFQVEVWDITKQHLTMTPYHHQSLLPLTDIQVASPDIVQISYEVTVFLPAGWTLTCSASESGVGQVSSDERTNTAGINPDEDQVIGIPIDITVFCSWPVDLDHIP